MGQATADLPDPLAASANGSNSTDDLLAQLAGEEIERLLAETESTPEPQPPEPPAAIPSATIAPSQPKIIAAPAAAAPAVPAAIVPPEAPPTAAPAEDLESIFTQLDERDKASAAMLPRAAAVRPVALEEPSAAEALAAEMAEDAAQHARPAGGQTATRAIDFHAAADASESDGDAKPSLLVMILAMLSSPLDSFSDQTRDLIGKAAILTMLNALCVLAYVVFFRR